MKPSTGWSPPSSFDDQLIHNMKTWRAVDQSKDLILLDPYSVRLLIQWSKGWRMKIWWSIKGIWSNLSLHTSFYDSMIHRLETWRAVDPGSRLALGADPWVLPADTDPRGSILNHWTMFQVCYKIFIHFFKKIRRRHYYHNSMVFIERQRIMYLMFF